MFVDLSACNRRLAALNAVQANILADRTALIGICSHVDLEALHPAQRFAIAQQLREFDMALEECRVERWNVCQLMELDEGEDAVHPVSITTVVID